MTEVQVALATPAREEAYVAGKWGHTPILPSRPKEWGGKNGVSFLRLWARALTDGPRNHRRIGFSTGRLNSCVRTSRRSAAWLSVKIPSVHAHTAHRFTHSP